MNFAMARHSFWTCLIATAGLLWGVTIPVSCNEESKLIGDLFKGYNKNIRPAAHPTDKVEVQVKLILTNLISLNEKEETLTTNVWIEIQWNDIRLAWNTSEYFGIEVIRVPYNTVWLPDIVLENNIDENGEWAIKHRPARKLINSRYTPDDLEYQEISFNLVIQRKPLFYIINIILPCSLISSLVVLAYFLPAQAGGQKLTVSISVLLAQTVFLFLIAQKVPETSLNVPLIGKYLIFVMSVTTLIATNQIVVLNISLRSPNTHTMSHTIKHVFLELVPRFLGMDPLVDDGEAEAEVNGVRERRRSSFGLMQRAEEYVLKQPRSEMMFDKQRERHGLTRSVVDGIDVSTTASLYKSLAQAAPEIKECVDACNFITESTKQANDIGSEMESWVLIGKMIDKVCFWVAMALFSIGTVAIFLTGHFNSVPDFPFPGENKRYLPS
ncbi:acetylcholine receptor subunit gamma isoform X2 [Oncorhynchus mykiss]|uniref:acetylcholine receptor subunit gamma isoform X2 n=1 Tax=Oncorhynchus mykiss TaxID=8022 RepID=UPI001877A874|nr:acetylcholine receptor subunit gamma isoform X2 [Oncorhynchus mykiss]